MRNRRNWSHASVWAVFMDVRQNDLVNFIVRSPLAFIIRYMSVSIIFYIKSSFVKLWFQSISIMRLSWSTLRRKILKWGNLIWNSTIIGPLCFLLSSFSENTEPIFLWFIVKFTCIFFLLTVLVGRHYFF